MDMPIPAFPQIPVHFHYFDGGQPQRSYRALCTTVPRAGELVFPEKGSPKVIVHAVAYRAETLPGGTATMIPQVFLRELTREECEAIGSIFSD